MLAVGDTVTCIFSLSLMTCCVFSLCYVKLFYLFCVQAKNYVSIPSEQEMSTRLSLVKNLFLTGNTPLAF